MKKLEQQIIKALSKKFKIPEAEFSVLKVNGKQVIVQNSEAGIYKGSWNDIMDAPAKDWSITVDSKTYDARSGMSWDVYKKLQLASEDKVDKKTYTWLTGEPVNDFMKHYWGVPYVPFGDWDDGQVKSYLLTADYQSDVVRPRLAVIVSDLEFNSSSEAPLPLEIQEIAVNGVTYVRKI